MRIHFVLNARIPNNKAYGIHVAKMCEAFIERGADVTLVIPHTHISHASLQGTYQLRVPVPTVVLPALDLYDRGRFAFLFGSLIFMISSFAYLIFQRMRGKLDVLYTINIDSFSFALLPLVGVPVYAEVHTVQKNTVLTRFFFRSIRGCVTLNSLVRDELMRVFGIPKDRFIVEPCGVEANWRFASLTKTKAREKLSLPMDEKIAVYAGRFFDWKGLDIFPRAFAHIPNIQCYIVGGPREEFVQATGVSDLPKNLHIMGECPSYEVPTWLAAADVLMVAWTRKHDASFRFMSPMKIIEYMASERPVVAANDPTITAVLPKDQAIFYEPDDAVDLAKKIEHAVHGGEEIDAMIARARETAGEHTHTRRAERIIAFIDSSTNAG